MNINIFQWTLSDEGTYVQYTRDGVLQEPVRFPVKFLTMRDVIEEVERYEGRAR